MSDLPNVPDRMPALDPWTLESLLAGDRPWPEPTATGAAELAALIAAARGPASTAELADETVLVAAFEHAARTGLIDPRSPRTGRSSMLSTLIGSKIALAAAASALTLGGASAAAYTNALPDAAQNAAHSIIGAPAAQPATSHRPAANRANLATKTTPVGPAATGPAAYGLCTSYAAQQAAGTSADANSVAFRNLATAAGGADNITAYCATVTKPGSQATAHPTGSPTSHPGESTAHATAHPTGSPTSHPGESTAHATAHPTGSPTSHPTGSPTSHPGGTHTGR